MTMPPIPAILTWGSGGTFLMTGDGLLAGNLNVDGHMDAGVQTTPVNPAANRYRLYPKADGHWYSLDSNGIELDLTTGGPPGPTGPQGNTGPQGAAGTGIQMMGSVATQADLPAAPAPQGNAYIVQADDSLWIADSTGTFVSGGSIQGPPGQQGPIGPAGNGIAAGGTQGQYLVKNSATDYDTTWASVPGLTQADADLRYLQLAGGTLSGPLVLAADPTLPLGAVTKQYVDALGTSIGTAYLPLAGGTLTGGLVLAADPTAPLQAATMQYVDARVAAVATTFPLLAPNGTYAAPSYSFAASTAAGMLSPVANQVAIVGTAGVVIGNSAAQGWWVDANGNWMPRDDGVFNIGGLGASVGTLTVQQVNANNVTVTQSIVTPSIGAAATLQVTSRAAFAGDVTFSSYTDYTGQAAQPANPVGTNLRLFDRAADNHLCVIDPQGRVTDLMAPSALTAVTTIPGATVPPPVATPPAGSYNVYVDSTTGQLQIVDSTGTVRPIIGADNTLRTYVQAKFATLDPGGAPAPVA